MSSRLEALAGRRAALVARSERDRATMAATFEGIERELAAADVVFTAARRAQRHPAFAIAGSVLTALAPLAARTVVRRALWIVPLAIAGYRVVKALRRGRS